MFYSILFVKKDNLTDPHWCEMDLAREESELSFAVGNARMPHIPGMRPLLGDRPVTCQ